MADPAGSHSESSDGASAAAGAYVDPASARAAVSRGRFLTGVTMGLGGLIGAAVTVPVIGFALGPSFNGEEWYWADLGATDQYPSDGKTFTPVTFERTPTGGNLARRVAFVRREAEATAGDDKNGFTVISNTCMHLGCPVQPTGTGFACPCHGGQYDKQGERTLGPPVRPLNRYETKVEADHLFVGRVFASKVIGGQVERSDVWKDPGQPVQGLLSFLYPAPPR